MACGVDGALDVFTSTDVGWDAESSHTECFDFVCGLLGALGVAFGQTDIGTL